MLCADGLHRPALRQRRPGAVQAAGGGRAAPPSCRWARGSARTRACAPRAALEIIIEQALVPVVVDAGIGAPSQAAEAMEMGADAVLVNTAIGTAGDPAAMAAAFRLAVDRRPARLPGRAGGGAAGGRRLVAAHRVPVGPPVTATSPLESRPDGVPPGTGRRRPAGHRPRRAAIALAAIAPPTPTSTARWRAPAAVARRPRRAAVAGGRRPAGGPGRGGATRPPSSASVGWCACSPRCTCRTSACRRAPTAGSPPATRSPAAPCRSTRWPAEGRALADRGFRHVLLVAGEHARIVSKDYLVDCVAALAPVGAVAVGRGAGVGRRHLPAPGRRRLRRPRRLPGDLRPRPPTRPSTSRARSATTTGAWPRPTGRRRPGMRRARHRRPARPGPRLAVRGAGPRPPTPRPCCGAGGGAR